MLIMQLWYSGLILAALPAFVSWVVITLPWERDVSFGFEAANTTDDVAESTSDYTREVILIPVHSEKLHTWLYVPTKKQNTSRTPPVVIMAQGLGTQKDIGLPSIASGLAAAGLAVLVFDYRQACMLCGFIACFKF
jgi:uncharacterized protein